VVSSPLEAHGEIPQFEPGSPELTSARDLTQLKRDLSQVIAVWLLRTGKFLRATGQFGFYARPA
jgi:hypothetical protein